MNTHVQTSDSPETLLRGARRRAKSPHGGLFRHAGAAAGSSLLFIEGEVEPVQVAEQRFSLPDPLTDEDRRHVISELGPDMRALRDKYGFDVSNWELI